MTTLFALSLFIYVYFIEKISFNVDFSFVPLILSFFIQKVSLTCS